MAALCFEDYSKWEDWRFPLGMSFGFPRDECLVDKGELYSKEVPVPAIHYPPLLSTRHRKKCFSWDSVSFSLSLVHLQGCMGALQEKMENQVSKERVKSNGSKASSLVWGVGWGPGNAGCPCCTAWLDLAKVCAELLGAPQHSRFSREVCANWNSLNSVLLALPSRFQLSCKC